MTEKEAYDRICSVRGDKPTVMRSRDYGDIYGFFLAPPGTDPSKPAFVGRMMTCVDKNTGEVFQEENWHPFPERAIRFALNRKIQNEL